MRRCNWRAGRFPRDPGGDSDAPALACDLLPDGVAKGYLHNPRTARASVRASAHKGIRSMAGKTRRGSPATPEPSENATRNGGAPTPPPQPTAADSPSPPARRGTRKAANAAAAPGAAAETG